MIHTQDIDSFWKWSTLLTCLLSIVLSFPVLWLHRSELVFTNLLQWFLTRTQSGNPCSTLCHVTVRDCSDVCVRCDKFHHRYLPKRPRKTMRKPSSPRSAGNIRVFLSLSRWYIHGYKPSCLFASVNFASWLTFLQSISASERRNRKEFIHSTWRPIHKL